MKITEVRLGLISVPLRVPFKTALRSVSSVEDVIVEIHTDTGAVGYGEAPPTGVITGDTTGAIIGAIRDHIAKTIIGRDVDDFEDLMIALNACIQKNTSAKAAVDMALWDLYGQLYKIPVYKLMGGAKKSIVTDIKEDCAAGAALIAQRCPDLRSRFIIQIYHPEEYDQVADLGFEHIILTVYQMSWSEKQDTAALVRFAAEHPLEGITFPAELADTPGYVEALLEAQVPLFVHTVNDPADQAALVRQGISGIYTDLGAPAPQE